MVNLPEYKLDLIPTDQKSVESRKFSELCWHELGKRWKVGGSPTFIQNEEWPKCECCGEKMSFYAQLDTVGEKFDIADCGLIYVFICFDCYTTKSIIQSY